MLNEIFKSFPQVITIHHEDELNSKELHGEKQSYSMIEIQRSLLIAVFLFESKAYRIIKKSIIKIASFFT